MFKFLRDKLYQQPLIGSQSFRDRILSNELLSNSLLQFLLAVGFLANVFGLFSPVLGSNDSNFYSVVAKHIYTSGNWIDLTFAGNDWLDKPHLPFWLTAISYKIFGVNAFAYVFPGFLFNLIGARYTYLLGRHFYTHQVGQLATIFYFTALHLMLSAIDVRAEAYLLGEIIPACYYWLLYNQHSVRKYLILGAFFTALAMMTKGIFVLVTIFSGLCAVWIYTKAWGNFISKKWWLAIGLSFVFISPELIALFVQFDMHPEKVIFDHTHVSGLKFFFWDSQFGRFFDTGPITSGHKSSIGHYFFFIHTFLWSFLPWSMIFLVALWDMYKDLRLSPDLPKVKEQKCHHLYLLGAFFPTFILFSATNFQLDHYTNILVPFAAIICANWICNKATRFVTHPLFYFQTVLAFVLCGVVTLIVILVFSGKLFVFTMSLCIICMALFGIFTNNRYSNKAVAYPVIAISLVFVFLMLVNGRLYPKYDAGYKIAEYLNQQTELLLVDYQVNSASLEFHNRDPYLRIDDVEKLNQIKRPYYLVVDLKQWISIRPQLGATVVLDTFPWIKQEKYIPTLFNIEKRKNDTDTLVVVFVADKTIKSLAKPSK